MTENPFDEKAATWDDDPAKVERSRQIADRVADAVPLGPTVRLLEYGAGTGLVTQALADRVGPVTLADSSRGMLDVLRAKVAVGTLGDAQVWDLDLARDPLPDERFDLVVTAMTLHHILDLDRVLAGFAGLLVDGGRLCVIDLDREGGFFHDADFDGHHGFDHGELADRLQAAGFADVRFTSGGQVTKDDRTYDLFLAAGTRS